MDNATTSFRFRGLAALMLAGTAMLAGCGGSDEPVPSDGADSGDRRATAAAAGDFFPNVPIPADAATRGMWSPVYNWPLIPIHVITLPDGRLLSYGTTGAGQQGGSFIYDVWDGQSAPDAGHLTLPNQTGTDIFCNTQILLPTSGTVFMGGGDVYRGGVVLNAPNNRSAVFDGTNNSLTSGLQMNRYRWYATSTTLVNGEIYIQGGAGGGDRAEIRGLDGRFRLLPMDMNPVYHNYPRNWVAPDNRVFGIDSFGKMYYVDPIGNTLTLHQQNTTTYGADSSAVMYRPGRILQFGGISASAITIDITAAGAPLVAPTANLSTRRSWVNGTVLPTGDVLATGGSTAWNSTNGINNVAEIWNPGTGRWLQGASGRNARLYHSMAILQSDGSVLVGGGGATTPTDSGPFTNTNVEVYYPPYLFRADGTRAPRPVLASAPTVLDIGRTFRVNVTGGTGAPSRVTLIKTGSVTHSNNMEQRFLDLPFRFSNGQLSVQGPTRAADATPGFYHLFVLDANGVPSVSRIVRMNVATVQNPAITPTLTSPGNQTSTLTGAVSIALAGTDPNGDTLTYAATGLPPGLTIDPATGIVSGTPTAAGTYAVVLSVTDGVNVASVSITWTITGSVSLAIGSVGLPVPTAVNAAASFTASATGLTPRYRWDFGDGSVLTPWSTAAAATHTYTRAGNFLVTLSVTDSTNVVLTRSFVQQVYLPATARKPTASSSVAYEPRPDGTTRLWVANQDQGTVSVINPVTRARIAEVPTGPGPRSLAVAANGMIWVANKITSSITVVDPNTLKVVNTIWTARAAQPSGLVMSPTGTTAFVTIEGLGGLQRYDTATYARTGAMTLPSNPRHLSVSADGATVYVSRFISPPLPGESTGTITTTGNVGGEVVRVNASTMTIAGTTVLRHSDTPDTEISGRGIPNYLGALAISPDGTQGYLPSKQDNIKRGLRRDGLALNFQNTVRAVSSRIVMATNAEDLAGRIDHDNASLASAAVYDPRGTYLFVSLETSRQIAVVDAFTRQEILRVDTGFAPQSLAVSPDGTQLAVNNFMDRSVGFYDLRPLLREGRWSLPLLGTATAVVTDALPATVLRGKKLFYDARDQRLARDAYMSCATCHSEGSHDGRVWDLSSQGEGLRNTIALRGRAGGQGYKHWSGNFDEIQDFEGQIRTLAGGTGLMSDAAFNTGTRSQPLGLAKTGVSADLDALAAYVSSLNVFDISPIRPGPTTMSAAATAGRTVYTARNCASCHGGTAFSNSGNGNLVDVGTIKPTSGTRLGAALTGLDIPTLRDVWMTAPYLHDGSATTLQAAIRAHRGVTITDADANNLAQYLREIGRDEVTAP